MPARRPSTKRPALQTRGKKGPAKKSPGKKGPAKAKRPAAISIPPGWRLDRGGKSMSIAVRTKDFVDAMDLLNAIAPIAEELGHHPDLHIERYNHVRIVTWSHDVGGLTDRDRRLAERITDVLQRRSLHVHATQ